MMRKESVLANLEKVEEVAGLAVNKMAQAQGNRPIFIFWIIWKKTVCIFVFSSYFVHNCVFLSA
jgi:hypothetical protein